MFERFTERARVYCPSCHTPIESIGTETTSGRFVVEGDGRADVSSLRRRLAPQLPRGVEDGRDEGG